jgi:hypothetical protein
MEPGTASLGPSLTTPPIATQPVDEAAVCDKHRPGVLAAEPHLLTGPLDGEQRAGVDRAGFELPLRRDGAVRSPALAEHGMVCGSVRGGAWHNTIG